MSGLEFAEKTRLEINSQAGQLIVVLRSLSFTPLGWLLRPYLPNRTIHYQESGQSH